MRKERKKNRGSGGVDEWAKEKEVSYLLRLLQTVDTLSLTADLG